MSEWVGGCGVEGQALARRPQPAAAGLVGKQERAPTHRRHLVAVERAVEDVEAGQGSSIETLRGRGVGAMKQEGAA